MKCPFCDAADQPQNTVLYTNNLASIIMDDPRKVVGHLLVIPIRHVERISELNQEEKLAFFNAVVEAEKVIVKHFGAGLDIEQHYRPYQKQGGYKVNHLHFHIVPRYEGDAFHDIRKHEADLYETASDEERREMLIAFGKSAD